MKKIKLPLEMANGAMVRTLDELKENWDLEKIVGYFGDGRLVTWLNDRYYTDLAEQVQKITAKGAEAQKQLCAVFGMEFKQDDVVDAEALAERKRKLDILRQFTSDDEILKNVDSVAFNQEDLADLLDEGVEKIYLCNGKFSVPLNISGKKYIGITDAEVYIGKDELQDFDKLGIGFENVKFDEKYKKLVDAKSKKQEEETQKSQITNFESAKKLYDEKKYEEAFKIFQVLADRKDAHAYRYLGAFYFFGYYVEENKMLAAECYMKAHELGEHCEYMLGSCYEHLNDKTNAMLWYEKGIEKPFYENAIHCIGELIDKNYETNNFLELQNLIKKLNAIVEIQENNKLKGNYSVAKSYAKVGRIQDAIEAADKIQDDFWKKYAYCEIGKVLFDGKVCEKNLSKAKEYFIKADDFYWIQRCNGSW